MEEPTPSSANPSDEFERLKSSIVSLISHELRTPLTYVSASVEMIEMALENPQMKQDIRRFLGIIDQGVKQLNTIVDELLLFSSLEKNTPDQIAPQVRSGVDIRLLVHDILNLLAPSIAAKQLEQTLDFPAELPTLTTDSGKLSEVLLQLLTNAIKFTPNGGKIALTLAQDDQALILTVADTGPGIPPEIQEKIFMPFFQKEHYLIREHGGLGLGLTLAQRLCHFLGAQLQMSSSPAGTTFTMRLPLPKDTGHSGPDVQKVLGQMQALSQSNAQKDEELSSLKSQLLRYTEDLHRAYQSNDQKQAEIESVYVDMIRGFAAALEARDPYTRGRSQRIAAYADLVAEALDLPAEEREWLQKGCVLCDIGYIGISDDILHKDGIRALTQEEKLHIQNHTLIGAQMVRSIKAFEPIVPLLMHHHENWNGTGYPHQLAGENIPFLARIIRIVDAFDAMLSDRSYRPRFSPDYALGEIQKCAGTQFDPELVKLFSGLWETGQLQALIASLVQEERTTLS